MERRNSKLNEVNVRITDKEVVKNVKAYCRLNNLNYSETKLKHIREVIIQPTSDDCISRQAVGYIIKSHIHEIITESGTDKNAYTNAVLRAIDNLIETLPPVTPTRCIAAVRFSKDDLREICNERIEIECTHGTCKDCEDWDKECNFCSMLDCNTGENFYCKDFEKRGSEE